MRATEGICGPRWRTIRTLAATALLLAVVTRVVADAAGGSPLVPFLSKPGEIGGFKPGKAQVFRTVAAVRQASGESPAKSEIRRYEAEGFIEAAIVRIHGQVEPAAKGVSSAFEFETPAGAEVEMKAELKEEFDPDALGAKGIRRYFTLRQFKVPGVPKAVGFVFVTNKLAAKLGVETGVANGLFVKGNCLLAFGIFRPKSKEVTGPVISGVQAISRRIGGTCP